jgi:hypothetical protein
MDNIIEPTIDYDFSNLYLGPPSSLAGGSYFTKIMYNSNKLLYLQTPKCLSKQGFVKSGKKIFIDLMFDNNDTVFINWIENLESKCQELLFSKGDTWFQTKLEKDDIETAFTSAFKIYKSGKYYLLRVNVKPNIKIYNETNSIVNLEDITPDKNIISILEIQGIKFTSRSFQIEIELKQSLIVSPDPFLDSCFIKNPVKNITSVGNTLKNEIKTEVKNEIKQVNKMDLDEFIKDSANDIINKQILETIHPVTNSLTEIDPFENYEDELKNENENEIENENENENEDNIILEIEELDLKEDPNLLKEFDLNSSLVNSLDTFTLKKPNQVYYDIYKKARDKAKEAKKAALTAYLELKEIKKTYMIDNIDDSDSDLEVYSDNESETETEYM